MSTITPIDIQAGDRLTDRDGNTQWIALSDARRYGEQPNNPIIVQVEHVPDGGLSERAWPANTDVKFHVGFDSADRVLTLAD